MVCACAGGRDGLAILLEICTEKGTSIDLHYRLITLRLINVYKDFTSYLQAMLMQFTSPFATSRSRW